MKHSPLDWTYSDSILDEQVAIDKRDGCHVLCDGTVANPGYAGYIELFSAHDEDGTHPIAHIGVDVDDPPEIKKANAAYIVKAAHSYPRVLSIAQELARFACSSLTQGEQGPDGEYEIYECGKCIQCRARALLAELKEGE